jgi:hypothetical protein
MNMNKKIIMDSLKRINPKNPNLPEITDGKYDLTEIVTLPDQIRDGIRVNARLRLICKNDKEWVGSRLVWFYREGASRVFTEKVAKFSVKHLPCTRGTLARYIFGNMNLEFEEDWIIGYSDRITDTRNNADEILSVEFEFNEKSSLFFVGRFTATTMPTRRSIDYFKNTETTLFVPLLQAGDTRIALSPYSFDFEITQSTVANAKDIFKIKSNDDLKANLDLFISVLSDLSEEAWTTSSDIGEVRPGGLFEFVYCGEISSKEISNKVGKNTMLPINTRNEQVLIVKLMPPAGSASGYVGYLCIYQLRMGI